MIKFCKNCVYFKNDNCYYKENQTTIYGYKPRQGFYMTPSIINMHNDCIWYKEKPKKKLDFLIKIFVK